MNTESVQVWMDIYSLLENIKGCKAHSCRRLKWSVLKLKNLKLRKNVEIERNDIVTNSQVLFHNGNLLHSKFNTQLLITVHKSSRILTQVQLLPVLEHNSQITLRKSIHYS
jgi:hypothetical protein